MQLEKVISDVGGWVFDGSRGKTLWKSDSWNFDSSLTKANMESSAGAFVSEYVHTDERNPSKNIMIVSIKFVRVFPPCVYDAV